MAAPKLAFIICSPRTGSTLLTRVLDSHSAIASPCEIPIPKYFRGDPSERLVSDKLREICRFYRADFPRACSDFDSLIEIILGHEQKKLLVVKYPRHALFLPSLVQDYPEAKYIHLVRDVRAVAMSRMYENKPQVAFRKWHQFNEAATAAMVRIEPDRRFFVRYEEIIENPAAVIARVVEFLGCDFEPAMLDYGRFPHADERMNLWWNKPPDQVPVHENLGRGTITKVESQPYSDTVETLYARNELVRSMNRSFGYN